MNERLPLGLVLGVALLFVWFGVGTVGFMGIEKWGFVDSLYMTVITISTVGFREVHPLSPPGRLFASLIIVGGLGGGQPRWQRRTGGVCRPSALALSRGYPNAARPWPGTRSGRDGTGLPHLPAVPHGLPAYHHGRVVL